MILRKILFAAILTWFTLTVLGYGIYRALPIILGPKIVISSPQNGDAVVGTSIMVQGTVFRTKSLFINEIPTPFNESGNFSTRIPIYTGSNLLIVEAVDRFGRSTKIIRQIGTK